MTVRLTDDQRRAVTGTGRDLCVVAGAGTGKTHVLTERIVRSIGDGLELDRLLAITFTEKAAAEMKHRLGAALLATGDLRARERVEAAAICTVHAFCARLLREHAVAAGVDPEFRVLDEVESDLLRRRALVELTGDWARAQPARLGLLARLPGLDPAEALLDVHRQARESGSAAGDFVRRTRDLPPLAPLLAAARGALAALAAIDDGGSPKATARIADLRRVAPALDAAGSADDVCGAAEAVLAHVSMSVPKAVKPHFAALDAALRALLSVALELHQAPLRAALADAVVDLDARYDAAKGNGAALDFADLELRAVRLLDEHAEVREAVRRRYTEALVDEFQDTNPLQARLVDLLRRPDGLFVVGDPKQAIYGFRGSDVDVFLERREAVARAGADGVVSLSHSFRSRPEVLAAVNRMFAAQFDAPPYEPLRPGRDFAPADRPCVELYACTADRAESGRRLEADWIARRIRALVEGDGDANEAPLRVAAPTPEDPLATRPATYGDVAILQRVTTNVKAMEHALTVHDVPYLVVKGRGFYHAREVVDLANLLACVANPADDVRLASVLRAPLCGASDDALHELSAARRGQRGSLAGVLDRWAAGTREPPGLAPGDADALRRFHATLAGLRAMRATAPLAELVDFAFAETGLVALALARPNGRQRAANLRKVRAFARDADGRGGVDLNAFVETMADLRAREVRETEAPVAAPARGAVSLLTVHAAKGLEFPIVFVPDIARRDQGQTDPVALHPKHGVGLPDVRPGSARRVRPWSHEYVRGKTSQAERSEGTRLLYVAATRAADHLVLSASRFERNAGPWFVLAGATLAPGVELPATEDSVVRLDPGDLFSPTVRVHAGESSETRSVTRARTLLGRVSADLRAGRAPADEVAPAADAEADRLWTEAARAVPPVTGTLYATTVSALVDFAACPAAFRRRHVLGLPDPDEHPFPPPGDLADGDAARAGDDDEWGVPLDARARGRAVHLALERLVPEFAGDVVAEARAALAAETGGGAPDPADVTLLAGWIDGFAQSDLGRAVAAAPRARVRREQAFLLRRGRTVVRGQLDLLFRGDAGWTIVDYKAGRLDAPGDAYTLQMRLYALALRAVTGEAAPRLVLFSLPEARPIEVPCTGADLDALESDLLGRFVRATADEDYAGCGRRDCAVCGAAT